MTELVLKKSEFTLTMKVFALTMIALHGKADLLHPSQHHGGHQEDVVVGEDHHCHLVLCGFCMKWCAPNMSNFPVT